MRKKYNLKSGKPKRKRIIIFVIILLIVLTIVFLYFKTDIFRTKRGAFIRYFRTTEKSVEILKDKDITKYNKNKRKNCYIRKGNLKIADSTNVADSGIMDKLSATINVKSNAEEEQKNMEVSFFSEGINLGTFSIFQEKELYGFFCQEVSPDYICVENKNIGKLISNIEYEKDGTMLSSALVNSTLTNIDFIGEEYKGYPIETILELTTPQKNKLNNYYRILKNNVPNDAYYGENDVNINIEGTDYKVNQYIMSVSGSQSAYLQISLLNELSGDSIMMDCVTSKMALLNFNEEYTDINKFNEIIKTKIAELNQAPADAKSLKIVVSNYKQQNIQTEITFGDIYIKINHIENDEVGEISIFTINDTSIKLAKKENSYKYVIKTKDEFDNEKSLAVDLKRTGTFEENNIVNKATIMFVDGMKKLTLEYEDVVQFVSVEELGIVNDFNNHSIGKINDYSEADLKKFISDLKHRINQVYILKGSQIGINLDPIFD